MQYMAEAVLIVHSKALHGRWIVQRKIWALPEAGAERPHGLKYSLFCGDAEHCLVRYDNEAGKGDHRHYGDREEPYAFTTLEVLLEDFQADVIRLTQE
ncbi:MULTISPECIES: toxin-antitoxin system TumE family protein [unclassified Rhodanobacter]|jgi:hypothetical protein|uniref:DUF6516 family protein n=1 Tax=Rhodanobacter humi TaxID=1888173 RepID=A0ABV4AVK9_9GAMM